MTVDDFIARWTDREGGAERANYVMFLTELCDVIGVGKPDPAGATRATNDYVFERAVRPRDSADTTAPQRIDLYKKGCFVLEAKQSRLPGKAKAFRELPGQGKLALDEPEHLGRRSVAKGWDVMMQNARKQGETYIFLLETSQPSPPFLIVCDVGHCFELYADFSGTGRAYSQFPDRKGFRIYLDDLRKAETRELLHKVWTEPQSLDPTKHAAKVTREIAGRLAEVSKRLEARGCNPEDVAHFLMRCLFTMFAEDVELLPKASFQTLLQESIADPTHFAYRLKSLWKQMDEGEHYSFVIKDKVRKFNGGLFKNTTAFDLDKEEIGELYAAAKHDWKAVDPAIFGTLLEQALDPKERRKLGAHYTPRAYVQRLVDVTIMEPLREDWRKALTKAERAQNDGDEGKAVAVVRAFHHQLCTTRVLDPACGTGNFLYVSLELMKKLEGEVLETLAKLGEPESMGFDREEIDPHQFLGLEINPRAAAIAELVIWLGYLQQHYRTRTGHPSEPILRDFKNINFGHRGGYDAVLTWDGYPLSPYDSQKNPTFPNPHQPNWPEADFIVGNPPFLGKGAAMRVPLGDAYVDALRLAYPKVNESADFVLFWWERSAEVLSRKKSRLRRFGLVTTNSISQAFNRRLLSRHISSRRLSLAFAIPDHPWTKATRDAAAVRIAMTVTQLGHFHGRLETVVAETGLGTDEPDLKLEMIEGHINANLTVGSDVSSAVSLFASEGICSMGPALGSRGFLLDLSEQHLMRPNLTDFESKSLQSIRNGDDLLYASRGMQVMNLSSVSSEEELRAKAPHFYQHLKERVFPKRQLDRDPRLRRYWWRFRRTNADYFDLKKGLKRYIATVETAKHRIFMFVEDDIVLEHGTIGIGFEDPAVLACLSSKHHVLWALEAGGTLEDRPRYNKVLTFDPFPFPASLERPRLRVAGEELDALRRRVRTEHPDLTLTGLYNVLEKIRGRAVIASASEANQGPQGTVDEAAGGGAGLLRAARNDGGGADAKEIELTDKEEDIKQRGLVLILKELHDEIDRLTAEAYGWPQDLSDEEILARLVALNAERAKEEAAGHVRWLRPDYQIPRFGKKVQDALAAKTGELDLAETVVAIDAGLPAFPADAGEATLAIEAALAVAGTPMTAAEIARTFKRGGKRIEQKVGRGLASLVLYGRIAMVDATRFIARKAA